MSSKVFSCCTLFLGICLLGTSSLHADLINYGDFSGDTVDFFQVTENSVEMGALYGAPTVNGNTLEYLLPGPVGFQSTSNDGDSVGLTGNLTFSVEAQDGFLISSISLEEFGTYFNFGDGSTSSVAAVMQVIAGGNNLMDLFSFTDLSDGVSVGAWMDDLTINFAPTDQIIFNLDNTLFTSSVVGGSSSINKDGITISVGTVPAIPEPASGMLLLGGICFGLVSRRRRS